MRYFWTFFWAFLLVQMLSYVVSSMTEGGVYDFTSGAIISVGVSILIIIATAVLPNEPAQKH
ncbi:putative PurR-regulated permease PerM [Neobacillus niacini]|uniref:YjzD family protein n=1 Tax=Neobacillus niacini TaxID=86668 RepID=UPI001043AA74|nr:YjzD family protein [Neobacillus niacini]MDR7076627.1 putative PurR-regulated permease PerM [Neobacillus niacini]